MDPFEEGSAAVQLVDKTEFESNRYNHEGKFISAINLSACPLFRPNSFLEVSYFSRNKKFETKMGQIFIENDQMVFKNSGEALNLSNFLPSIKVSSSV